MNRRGFFGRLAALVTGVIWAPKVAPTFVGHIYPMVRSQATFTWRKDFAPTLVSPSDLPDDLFADGRIDGLRGGVWPQPTASNYAGLTRPTVSFWREGPRG